MKNRLRDIFIGKPLKDSDLGGEKFGVLWGLPIYSSDTISSVAYAGEEVLMVLPVSLYTSPSPRDLSTSRMPSSA